MNREDKVNKIVDQVDGWDLDTVMEYAKNKIREQCDGLSDDEVTATYIGAGFSDDDEDDECGDCGNNYTKCACDKDECFDCGNEIETCCCAEEEEQEIESCDCSMDVIMALGCQCGGQ